MKPEYLWILFKSVQVNSREVSAVDAAAALSSEQSGKCFLVSQMGNPEC